MLLGDLRPAWRRRATESLAARGPVVVKAIEPILSNANSPPTAAMAAVWAACRIDAPEARQAIRQALGHRDETVRQAAIHAVSVSRDAAAVPALTSLLQERSAQNERAAAESARSHRRSNCNGRDFKSFTRGRGRSRPGPFAHVCLDSNRRKHGAARGGSFRQSRVRRAALVALDQCGAELDAKAVIELLDDSDPGLARFGPLDRSPPSAVGPRARRLLAIEV